MALLFPQPGDRGEPDVKTGRTGGSAVGEDRRLVRNGVQVLSRGSLACPSCALPLAPSPRLHPRAMLSCGFCDHTSAAIEFMHRDAPDAPASSVALVARLG
jgi:hypothetical protein